MCDPGSASEVEGSGEPVPVVAYSIANNKNNLLQFKRYYYLWKAAWGIQNPDYIIASLFHFSATSFTGIAPT